MRGSRRGDGESGKSQDGSFARLWLDVTGGLSVVLGKPRQSRGSRGAGDYLMSA